MALATYSDLLTAIPNWLARTGDTVITANAADFVSLCEVRIAYGSGDEDDPDRTFYSRPLRIRAMEREIPLVVQAVVPISTVGGTASAITLTPAPALGSYALGNTFSFTAASTSTGATTVNISALGAVNLLKGSALSALGAGDLVAGATAQIYYDGTQFVLMPGTANVPLPVNYLAMRAIYLDTNPRTKLNYIGPEELNTLTASTDIRRPSAFTIEGDTLRLGPPPDTAYNLFCLYYQKFGALSAAANWLMTNAPNVYLFGALLEAAIFLGDNTGAQRWLALYKSACNALQGQDARDRHSGATLVIQNDTGNP